MHYRERLRPATGYFITLILLIPFFLAVTAPINIAIGYVIAPIIFLVVFLISLYSSPIIEVSDGRLTAGRATIDLGYLGSAEVFTGERAAAERGRDLDARAYLCIRGGKIPVVKIENTDQEDPCPYWLVSSRTPNELVSALERGRAATPDPTSEAAPL